MFESEVKLPLKRDKTNKLDSVLLKFVFTGIYDSKYWFYPELTESVSGIGSSLRQTETLRKQLPELFKKYRINTVLDIACGDFNWMKHTDLTGINYTGADIVEKMIVLNQEKYSNGHITFKIMDIIASPLPEVDLIICRDCLVHFSYRHIFSSLENIIKSKSRFLLTTTFYKHINNFDIQSGKWRPLNLEASPFNFNRPLELLSENCSEGRRGEYNDKSLGLWSIADIYQNK